MSVFAVLAVLAALVSAVCGVAPHARRLGARVVAYCRALVRQGRHRG